MPETGTSGLINGERKRSAGSQSETQATVPLLELPFYPCRCDGTLVRLLVYTCRA